MKYTINIKPILFSILIALYHSPVFVFSANTNQPLYFDNLSVDDGLSQISVITIYQDSQGYMWFGTRDGLNRYDGYEFKVFTHDAGNNNSICDNYVKCITEDKRGRLWIGTTNGLDCYNPAEGTFSHYLITESRSIGNFNEINDLYYDSNTDQLWIGTYHGLFTYDNSTGILSPLDNVKERVFCITAIDKKLYIGQLKGIAIYNTSDGHIEYHSPFEYVNADGWNSVRSIYQDSKSQIWLGSGSKGMGLFNPENNKITKHIEFERDEKGLQSEIRAIKETLSGQLVIGTHSGMHIYSPQLDMFVPYTQSRSAKGNLQYHPIESVYVDNSGIVWAGTYSGGVCYSNELGGRFRFHNPSSGDQTLGIITTMTESNGTIWMGTEGGGLLAFDPSNETYEYYPRKHGTSKNYGDNNIKSLYLDRNILYIGVFTGWIYLFDIKLKKYIGEIRDADMSAIYAIKNTAKDDGLLIGSYSNNALKILKNKQLNTYSHRLNEITQISTLLSNGNDVYIGTRSNGLYVVNDEELEHFSTEKPLTISSNKITTIFKDSQGKILVGTSDGGLNIYDPLNNNFKIVRRSDGLGDDKVCSIVEDKNGSLWIITRIGISELNANYEVVRSFDHTSGLPIQEYSINSAIVTHGNTIYIGGDKGLISFNPDKLKKNMFIPPIVILSVKVNNIPVYIDFANNPSLNLEYDQTNLTITYSALNYLYTEQNEYKYILEGVDNDWNYIGGLRTVNYANLAPGNYTFRVKGSNSDGLWNEQGTEVKIIISPPFWKTGWAILLYICIATIILFLILRYYRIQQHLKQEVVLKQQQEELYKAQIDLYTNISHEFRTPLTLIAGPIEEVMMSNGTHKINNKAIGMIYTNTRRLMLLVDQLMSFRKYKDGQMAIKVAEGDFIGFVREIEISFGELSRMKNIELETVVESIPKPIWYDRNMFERVLTNLLSNAFKYTESGGRISITLSGLEPKAISKIDSKHTQNLYKDAVEYMKIVVQDNGAGIDEDELGRIFNPFYQARGAKEGTGIGLSISKGIIERHHGAIWAQSPTYGGLQFTILLPCGNAHFTPAEIIPDYHSSEDITRYYSLNDEGMQSDISQTSGYSVLIVEDNSELRSYIKSCIKPYYKVLEASNGKEGFAMSVAEMPNIILSDIMMPEMDGLQMCRKLKDDLRTSHIPVILLTARALVLQMKEGLEFGADDYITKPFNINILLLKIKNILASRENLKNLYAQRLSLENMGVEVISSEDRFLQKLNEVVEQNITDPNLDVERFCEEINMSRASLYRKLMATTNMSPAKYIQSVRLHLAAKMLRETDLSISDVSYQVGFNSLIHFSSIFRKQYGVPPSKYRKDDENSV